MNDRTDEGQTEPSDRDALWKPVGALRSADGGDGESPPADAARTEGSEAASPWSEGSDVEFAPSAGFDTDVARASALETVWDQGSDRAPAPSGVVEGERADGSGAGRSARRRSIALVMMIALLVAGAIVARSDVDGDLDARVISDGRSAVGESGGGALATGGEPLVTAPFAGADRRRLPDQLEQRWRVVVDGVAATGRTQLRVLDDGSVVGVFDDRTEDDGRAASVISLLASADGTELWRTSFDSQARAFKIMGSFGEVVVVERVDTANRAVVGLSIATGEVLWVRETNDPGVHVVLEGTELVARVTFTVNARLTFIDPATGEEVGRVPGRLFATDFLGTWYVRNADAVSKLDLRTGWRPPTPFDTLWVDDDEPASVVGGRLIVIGNGSLQVRGSDGEPTDVATIGAAASGGFAGLDTGANFTRLSPMVGDSFVAVGARSVFGAVLDENGDADVRWRATGTPIDSRPTDRGLSLLVATEGGGAQRVIDASTGSEIAVVEMVPGFIDTLELVGNGVVLKRSAQIGVERIGLDLDGNRLWTLVGDGPLAIGDGVVVTHGASDGGIAVTAYGGAAT